jgi:hypothetical protein
MKNPDTKKYYRPDILTGSVDRLEALIILKERFNADLI